MFTKEFWLRASERALKSGAQFGGGVWAAAMFTAVGDVVPVATATGLAFLWGVGSSIFTSMASEPFGDSGTPSLIKS